jgi:glycosyltransferase involved in cell wall biosynthesis
VRTGSISVVVAAYGNARFLAQTLDSILTQSRPAAEVIVINDGSPDDTTGAVAPYLDRITYIEQENRGFVATMNRGVDLAAGDYVFPFSSDDWLQPDAFEVLAGALDRDAGIGLAYGGVKYADEHGRVLERPRWVRFPVGTHRQIERLIRRSYIPGMAVLLRRAALDDAGPHLLDFAARQDWALWVGVGLSGWSFHGVDRCVAFYRRHGSNMTERTTRFQANSDLASLAGLLFTRYGAAATRGQRRAIVATERQARRKMAFARLADGERHDARRRFTSLLLQSGDLKAGAGLLLSLLPSSLWDALLAVDARLMKTHNRAIVRLKQWL